MTRDQQIAWAAGLVEGEGCITGSVGKTDIHAALVMADEDTVRRFAAIIGLGSVRLQTRRVVRPNRKSMWRWQADGNYAEYAVRVLLPYLGARRSARARELLQRRDEWRAEVLAERRCLRCLTPFTPKLGPNARKQVYCSRRCQMRATDARRWQRKKIARKLAV